MTQPASPTTASAGSNTLAGETSPYLQQHAGNPVHWQPWGPAALDLARRDNKPILLSIGYSACHWCHVMAHESFEDEATAKLMNELYVNIKVDREERPDLDKIYQTAHQLLTQRGGGWPLTMFLTPDDQRPFFAGTYFPVEARFGMPSFKELLTRVDAFYRENQTEIQAQNKRLVDALTRLEPRPAGDGGVDSNLTVAGDASLRQAGQALAQLFDARYGGFGHAPKFPHCGQIERLMRDAVLASSLENDPGSDALQMAAFTLEQMARGGLYDQLGGGFCRYSVDERWAIPHFEKMLYDNGPLLGLYAQMFLLTAKPVFERVALETAQWVMREMQSPEGGYYSTLDADSEGVEGKFYVWTPEEVGSLLDGDEYQALAARFGLDGPPNFENRFWHLAVARDISEIAAGSSRTREQDEQLAALIDRGRAKLLAARSQRVWPGRDEKVLTSWNALMIKGMAIAGRSLVRSDCIESAERALEFLRTTLLRDGRLLATYKDGRAHLNAYLDDYAFTLDAILHLLECRWQAIDLDLAVTLADTMLEQFEDDTEGGFFFTSDDHEALIVRNKPLMDDASPAGNGVAAHALMRLGHLTGNMRYLDAAHRALRIAQRSMAQVPHAHSTLLVALEEYLYPPQIIVLRGNPEHTHTWQARASAVYAPRRFCVAIGSQQGSLPGLLDDRVPHGDATVTAYVCQGHHCEAPVTDFDTYCDLMAAIEPTTAPNTGEAAS